MKALRTVRIPAFNVGLWNTHWLGIFLGSRVYLALWPWGHDLGTAWLGWGAKRSANRAKWYAHRNGDQILCLEDGFLRSFNMGRTFTPLSMVVDDIGIYYDSNRPSVLENLLNANFDVLDGLPEKAYAAKDLILSHHLSKYNHPPNNSLDTAPYSGKKVLVIDQTVGDMSVMLGGISNDTFDKMLAAARSENSNAIIYVKTHPEVTSGRKTGYLTHIQNDAKTVLLRHAINPLSLIEKMDRVYVVTSGMGFEALLAGKPVVCFGVPWYAGWGVTDDRCIDSPAWSRRNRQRSVDELFAAAYIHYTRYLDPVTHQRGTIMDVIHWLIRQRQMASLMHGEDRSGRVIGVGFRSWKASNLKPMLGLHPRQVMFANTVQAADELEPLPADTLLVWGATPPAGLAEMAKTRWARLLHIEDGFVRSVGLGSDLIRPLSLVLDERGIYFDATRPSDLEHMLSTRDFTEDDLTRAQAVRAFIVKHDITKYNLEPRQSVSWLNGARRVLLVPGQVEDDASIRLGCTSIRTNLHLLQAVRAANPNAFIVYKPHPDVLSRNRKGQVALDAARQYADHIESGVSVVSCIDACDEVHTMTSLTGFDALLRGKKVVTYGQPFYAGWGLTEDCAEQPLAFERRQRRLSLDELVAGALLHYPIYWDWDLKGYTTCEAVLHRIVEQRSALEANGGLRKLHTGWLRRQWRKLGVLVTASLLNA